MKILTILTTTLVSFSLFSFEAYQYQEVSFDEKFVFNPEEALKELIPGTKDYYYYNCLHLQHKKEYKKVNQLLKAWHDKFAKSERYKTILNRQMLYLYEQFPSETQKHLIRELRLQFNHQKLTAAQEDNYPDSLDQREISWEKFKNYPIHKFTDLALERLSNRNLSVSERRALLQRVTRSDYPNLVKHIIADLSADKKTFGYANIHKLLTLQQMNECLKLKSSLKSNRTFVYEYIKRLAPPEHTNWQQRPFLKEAYLNDMWKFVSSLGPAFNSLKAHSLLHKLKHDQSLKKYNEANFLEYLKLPRYSAFAKQERLSNNKHIVNLNQNFEAVTFLSTPSHLENELAISLMQYFLKDAPDTKKYLPYVPEGFLNKTFAKTKILYGKGDPEKWFSLIEKHTSTIQELKEKVELRLLPENKEFIRSDEEIQLSLEIKNAPNLLVKIFKLNQFNYYKANMQQLSTDLDLDGMVATQEKTFNYTQAPHIRHTETFNFDLKDPGAYVVEFIGNGISSRALIHKGYVRYTHEPSAAGHLFYIFDDKNNPLTEASIYIDGHTYENHEKGFILVPYTSKSKIQKFIIKHGEFASLESFKHKAENYKLDGKFFIHRESLIPNSKATAFIHTSLHLNGSRLPLKLLKNVSLTLTSTDSKGIASSLTVDDFKLLESKNAPFTFNVPKNLRHLTFTLKAQINKMTDGKTIDLQTKQKLKFNSDNNGTVIKNAFLRQDEKGYYLEVLGRNGEPQKNLTVNLRLVHALIYDSLHFTLQTNEQGTVFLGKLKDITAIQTNSLKNSRYWYLKQKDISWPHNLSVAQGEVIRLPFMSKGVAIDEQCSLIEFRAGHPHADHSSKLSLDGSYLEIKNLPEGSFKLRNKANQNQIDIRITKGKNFKNFILGDYETNLKNYKSLPIIKSVSQKDNSLKIKLENHSAKTKIHIVQSRFHFTGQPGFAHQSSPASFAHGYMPSFYLSGRNIGDEYRYILARRNSPVYPGNMLARPGLLLNPWELKDTTTEDQYSDDGGAFGRKFSEGKSSKLSRDFRSAMAERMNPSYPSYNFLTPGQKAFTDLRPNDQGVIEISKLGKGEMVHIFLLDNNYRQYKKVFLPQQKQPYQDIRQRVIFNPEKHFVESKKISILRKDKAFTVKSISSAQLQTYDSLQKVYNLFKTLNPDKHLSEFSFILDWPTLGEARKKELYSKYACHELNFFIFKKDPQFFQNVILPYYQNKKQDTFLDSWLKDSKDISKFTHEWHYHRLNVAEKILLAKKLDISGISQEVQDIFQTLPRDRNELSRLFNTALQSESLSATKSPMQKSLSKILNGKRGKSDGKELPKMVGFISNDTADDSMDLVNGITGELTLADEYEYNDGLEDSIEIEDDPFGDSEVYPGSTELASEAVIDARGRMTQYYKEIGPVKEWAENNYHRLPINKQTANLVTVNAFWRDYAAHTQGPFISINFAEATKNFTEMMFALALLDLPFTSQDVKVDFKDSQMQITPASDLVLFHREVDAIDSETTKNILVKQQFFDFMDRYKNDGHEKIEKYISSEFLSGRVYGAKIIISNANAQRVKLEILKQIPAGAIPVNNSQETMTSLLTLNPYATTTMEYFFYFPQAGNFNHFPVHASQEGELSSFEKPFVFKVVDEATEVDKTSWVYISQSGNPSEVIEFLKKANLNLLDLSLAFWRLQDKQFCSEFLGTLKSKNVYQHQAYAYAIKHNLTAFISEYLKYSTIANRVGPYINSKLLVINPVDRFKYEFKEYSPLINARSYQLGKKRAIANRELLEQYNRYMHYMSHKAQITPADKLTQSYLLLLQDRITEGIELFKTIKKDDLLEKIQYDYMQAYIFFYLEQPDKAEKIALQYTNYPVNKWQEKFKNVLSQLREIRGIQHNSVVTENRGETQNSLANQDPIIEFDISKDEINAYIRNLDEVTVNYYPMDIELLFSRKPFISKVQSDFSIIKAKFSEKKKVIENKLHFKIPDSIKDLNVMVEIAGKGTSAAEAYYSHNMKVAVSQNYGMLQVLGETQKPLSKVYVKVYSKGQNGEVKFHKDGYTDLRGKFDYSSINNGDISQINSFSLLLLSDKHGAMIREVRPPKL